MQVTKYNVNQKLFAYKCSKYDLRVDGRKPLQVRPMSIQLDAIGKSLGSAKVTIGKTECIATVKAKLSSPSLDEPDRGLFRISLFCSPTVRRVTRKIGEQRFREIRTKLREAYSKLPMEQFCIVSGKKCWKVKVKIVLLSYGGTFYDAATIAVKAALMSSVFPRLEHVRVKGEDRVRVKIKRSTKDAWTPALSDIPITVTLRKVGDMIVADSSVEEEEASLFSYVAPVTEHGTLLGGFKVGKGHADCETLLKMIEVAQELGTALHLHVNKYIESKKR